jgi:hypothetical protein
MTSGSSNFDKMSDAITTESVTERTTGRSKSKAQGVRYSLKEMLDEVGAERKHSALGRELLDSTEIGKMFANKRRGKRTKK